LQAKLSVVAERERRQPRKIISGGQTGADRAALDAARARGWPIGGWCPRDRDAEDGPIDTSYPLRETESLEHAVRTEQNVIDSDGTAIIAFGPLHGGSALTERLAHQHGKPVQVIDAESNSIDEACEQLRQFTQAHPIEVLNVAGPRGSNQPAIYRYVHAVIDQLLRCEDD
jgi:hypothetical protein